MTNDSAARLATGKNAVVVQGHFKQLVAEAEDQLQGTRRKTIKQSYGSGTADGHAAGDKVKLRQELTSTKQLEN